MKKHVLRFLMLTLPVSISCIHVIDAPYPVKEDRKEALLFEHDGLSHLVVRTRISSPELPRSLAWIIPTPKPPILIKEESADLFPQLYKLIPDRIQTMPTLERFLPGCSTIPVPGEVIVVHQPKSTEHYTTQTIEIRSENAAEALNGWLVKNGFSPVPEQNQRHYLIPGRAFVCVKIRKLPGGGAAQIPPVHLAWRGEQATLPLKFSSHSGVFDVDLYVLSQMHMHADQFAEWHFRRVGALSLAGSSAEQTLSKLAGMHTVLTRYHAKAFNSSGHEVTRLASDPLIDLGKLR
ncbi:MAG: DUF2330 domain-containing protein [Prosthecobacter sp.]